MAKLAMDLHDEIKRLIRDPKYGSGDRARDQARTKLKRLGLIEFDRKAWEWVVLPAGRAAMEGRDG